MGRVHLNFIKLQSNVINNNQPVSTTIIISASPGVFRGRVPRAGRDDGQARHRSGASVQLPDRALLITPLYPTLL